MPWALPELRAIGGGWHTKLPTGTGVWPPPPQGFCFNHGYSVAAKCLAS